MPADKEGVDAAHFPWRPLGAGLVDQGLLTEAQLEFALAEQRRSGRLLGQILLSFGYLSGHSLACALAEQHGVALRPRSGTKTAVARDLEPDAPHVSSSESEARREWRPLGRLLVEKGFLSTGELEEALAQQRRRRGGRLGEILVERGHLSGPELARVLAEQHGVELTAANEPNDDLETVITQPSSAEPVYQVCEVQFAPSYQAQSALYESANFLDAADFAFEFVEEHEPEGLEIRRSHGETRETVWMYSASRAAAIAASRKDLTETFGFDPISWDGSPPARDFTDWP